MHEGFWLVLMEKGLVKDICTCQSIGCCLYESSIFSPSDYLLACVHNIILPVPACKNIYSPLA